MVSVSINSCYLLILFVVENEIHKTSLKMMEGEMVRKKYNVIQDMLRREKIHYTRQQRQLEQVIQEQNKELGNWTFSSRVTKFSYERFSQP